MQAFIFPLTLPPLHHSECTQEISLKYKVSIAKSSKSWRWLCNYKWIFWVVLSNQMILAESSKIISKRQENFSGKSCIHLHPECVQSSPFRKLVGPRKRKTGSRAGDAGLPEGLCPRPTAAERSGCPRLSQWRSSWAGNVLEKRPRNRAAVIKAPQTAWLK